jgi:hypothetical protein
MHRAYRALVIVGMEPIIIYFYSFIILKTLIKIYALFKINFQNINKLIYNSLRKSLKSNYLNLENVSKKSSSQSPLFFVY